MNGGWGNGGSHMIIYCATGTTKCRSSVRNEGDVNLKNVKPADEIG
jgi:hypothetical protein